jgi:hypothetical protein
MSRRLIQHRRTPSLITCFFQFCHRVFKKTPKRHAKVVSHGRRYLIFHEARLLEAVRASHFVLSCYSIRKGAAVRERSLFFRMGNYRFVLLVLLFLTINVSVTRGNLQCVTHCQAPKPSVTCTPVCFKPNCSYHCQDPAHEAFCATPHCHTECANLTLPGCGSDTCPLCEIKCSNYINCKHSDCDPVCYPPQCGWKVQVAPLPPAICDVKCERMVCSLNATALQALSSSSLSSSSFCDRILTASLTFVSLLYILTQ